MTFTTDEPELIVRLYQEQENGQEVVQDVYELPQYAERLKYMREVYADIQAQPGLDWANWYKMNDLDPWEACTYKEVMEKVIEIDHERVMHQDALNQVAEAISQMRRDNAKLKQRFQTNEEEAER